MSSKQKKERAQMTVPIFREYHPILWTMLVDGDGKLKDIGGGRGRKVADLAEKCIADETTMTDRLAKLEDAILSMQKTLAKIIVSGGTITQDEVNDLKEQQDAFQSEFGDIFNQ